MAILVSEVLRSASVILLDEAFVRWTKAELIGWVNEGSAEIVRSRPAANALIQTPALVEGTRQLMPSGTYLLLDIPRTMLGVNIPGRPMRLVDRRLLDDQQPDWHQMRPTSKLRHFTYDPQSPAYYYVYPPAIAGTLVELLCSAAPAVVSAETDLVSLNRCYTAALVNYVVYRAFAKDSEYANGQMATLMYQAYGNSLNLGETLQNEGAA